MADAIALMGELPREVFDGSKQPRYTKRRAALSELELRLLKRLPLDAAAVTAKDAQIDPSLQSRLV